MLKRIGLKAKLLIKSPLPMNICMICQYYQDLGSTCQSHRQDTSLFPHLAEKTQKHLKHVRPQNQLSELMSASIFHTPFQESTMLLNLSYEHFHCEQLILLQNWIWSHNDCIWVSEMIWQTLSQRLLQPLMQPSSTLVSSSPIQVGRAIYWG